MTKIVIAAWTCDGFRQIGPNVPICAKQMLDEPPYAAEVEGERFDFCSFACASVWSFSKVFPHAPSTVDPLPPGADGTVVVIDPIHPTGIVRKKPAGKSTTIQR